MRNMSFSLTTDQVRARMKTVTRRLGWRSLKPGDRIRAIVKGQGLKKGEKVQPLAVLLITSVRRERLSKMISDPGYGSVEVVLEGFRGTAPAAFVAMFCEANGCQRGVFVTRIEFEYPCGTTGDAR